MIAIATPLPLIRRLAARWRVSVSAFVALAVLVAAATPALASLKHGDGPKSHVQVAQEWAVDTSKHSNSIKDDGCDDGACLTFHGSHCHHQMVGMTSATAYAPPIVSAALLALSDPRRAAHPTWPTPKPPRA